MATIEDVAKAAGLSAMTVSRALNQPQLVRAQTIEKVKAAVALTGYIPNLSAGSLVTKRSKLIAVLVPQINNSMFVDTIQAISDELSKNDYHMLLSVTGYAKETECDVIRALLSRKPDGIVITGIHHSPEAKRLLLNSQIPVMEIWDYSTNPLDMIVGFSHVKVGNVIGQFLKEKGHHRIGLLWTEDSRAESRAQGIREMFTSDNATIAEHYVPLPTTLALGRAGFSALYEKMPDLTAVICSSDTLAQGAIIEAEACGLRVPTQIAVMGFGNLNFSESIHLPITTVDINRTEIGRRAAEMLLQKIKGVELDILCVDTGYQLIQRQST